MRRGLNCALLVLEEDRGEIGERSRALLLFFPPPLTPLLEFAMLERCMAIIDQHNS
jgi:hypothetical protein